MKSIAHFLLIVFVLAGVNGCGGDSTQDTSIAQPSKNHPDVTSSLTDRLLLNLDDRKTWPSNNVKINLNAPTVSVNMPLPDEGSVKVNAWPHNSNDFNIAMMRFDQGNILYAITDEEFQALQELERSVAVP